MKNMNRTRNAQLTVPGIVPEAEGAFSGDVVILNSAGLRAVMITPIMTAEQLADFSQTNPHSLSVGEAALELLGISISQVLPVPGAVAQWQAIYKTTASGLYSTDATGGVKIGYALEAKTEDGPCKVALLPST